MENNTCHGCGNKYDNCICEELDAERDDGKHPDDDPNDGDYDVEDNFQPCSECDGHDACSDFGCAIKAGLGHMLQHPL